MAGLNRNGQLIRTVVFTGKGIDRHTNKLRSRDEWTRLANAKGYAVDDKVRPSVDFLVASRDDTKKARDARCWGIKVISYNDFDAMLRGIVVDDQAFDAAPPPPIDMVGMEEIDGWGMF